MATDPTPQIHAEMAAILDELPAIGKDSRNAALNFSFRGIDAIINALNPLLGKHGVVPVLASSQLLHYEAKTKGYAAVVLNTYRFTARDGSFVEAQAVGEGHDFGDKAVTKASTLAQKTCLGQTFCLATEDDPDGDVVHQPEPKAASASRAGKAAKATKEASPAAPSSPAAPPGVDLEQLRSELWSKVDSLDANQKTGLKERLVKDGISTDFDAHTKEDIDKIAAILVTDFGDPF